MDGIAAELARRHFEGHARTGRFLLEYHGQCLAGEHMFGIASPSGLDGAARLADAAQFILRDIDQIEKMERNGRRHPAAPCPRGRGDTVAPCVFEPSALAMRAQARSIRCTPSAISSSVMISGGRSRTTLSPAATAIIFSARNSSTSSLAGPTARKPISRPAPRTSAMTVG